MKGPTPFAWLLLSAAFASFSALVLVRWPAPVGAQVQSPVVEASADSYALLTLFRRSAAPVTGSQPAVAPAATATREDAGLGTEYAVRDTMEAVATGPAAATPIVPAAPVATLPAGVTRAEALDGDREKEAALLDLLNAARLAAGAETLDRNSALDEVALARARNLIENNYFDHYAPDGSSAFSELAARGLPYRLAGENLARNNYPAGRTVQAAFEGLMGSPGHRANILEPRFGAVGLASVPSGRFWLYVMVFTNPR